MLQYFPGGTILEGRFHGTWVRKVKLQSAWCIQCWSFENKLLKNIQDFPALPSPLQRSCLVHTYKLQMEPFLLSGVFVEQEKLGIIMTQIKNLTSYLRDVVFVNLHRSIPPFLPIFFLFYFYVGKNCMQNKGFLTLNKKYRGHNSDWSQAHAQPHN